MNLATKNATKSLMFNNERSDPMIPLSCHALTRPQLILFYRPGQLLIKSSINVEIFYSGLFLKRDKNINIYVSILVSYR